MRTLLLSIFAICLGLSLGMNDAEAAKRFGGGQSLGKQRDSVQREAAPRPPAQAPNAAPQSTPAPRPGFGGAIAGLLAGGLIGAMLFGGAFDGIKFADVAMLALLLGGGWFLLRTLSRSRASAGPALQTPGPVAAAPAPLRFGGSAPQAPALQPNPAQSSIPADFDQAAFLEHARRAFVNLQAANDSGDLRQIRDFTTPELYAELESQVSARGNAAQETRVTTLDTELLSVVEEGQIAIASVRFSGSIRESGDALPEAFEEIWHVTKDLADKKSVWLLAGIQQIQ
jgi:predicted lipid-binding transport protein (Tim44 family)